MSLRETRKRLLAVIDQRIADLHPQPDRGIRLEKSDPQVWACEQRPRGCYHQPTYPDARAQYLTAATPVQRGISRLTCQNQL